MSAEHKFQIVSEREVWCLSKSLQRQWNNLLRRKRRLDEQQAVVEAAFKKFFGIVERKREVSADQDQFKGLRLNNDGTVYGIYCKCPPCQAKLHGLSIQTTVEEMIKQKLIKPNEIKAMRQRAAAADSFEHAEAQKNLLRN